MEIIDELEPSRRGIYSGAVGYISFQDDMDTAIALRTAVVKDGMLYADAGDNTQTFTQGGNTYRVSQTLSNLLGKQLRIDVSKFNTGVATRDDTAVGHLILENNE